MRAAALLLTVILLPVGIAQQSSMNRSETKGSCSPATQRLPEHNHHQLQWIRQVTSSRPRVYPHNCGSEPVIT